MNVVQTKPFHFLLFHEGEAYELEAKSWKELVKKLGELIMIDFKVWW